MVQANRKDKLQIGVPSLHSVSSAMLLAWISWTRWTQAYRFVLWQFSIWNEQGGTSRRSILNVYCTSWNDHTLKTYNDVIAFAIYHLQFAFWTNILKLTVASVSWLMATDFASLHIENRLIINTANTLNLSLSVFRSFINYQHLHLDITFFTLVEVV